MDLDLVVIEVFIVGILFLIVCQPLKIKFALVENFGSVVKGVSKGFSGKYGLLNVMSQGVSGEKIYSNSSRKVVFHFARYRAIFLVAVFVMTPPILLVTLMLSMPPLNARALDFVILTLIGITLMLLGNLSEK